MNRTIPLLSAVAAAGLLLPQMGQAQGLPKSQPRLLTIIREEVKAGANEEHAKHESGWPAAYEKAKSPDFYLALTSLTGPNEAWYLVPSESHAAWGAAMKREEKDPTLAAEVARLAKEDAQYIKGTVNIQAVARPDLSFGDFPDLAKARFYEIVTFRVRPGHEAEYEATAKAYAAARGRAGVKTGYRVYQVIAGMPVPAYLAFVSVEDYGEFDALMAASRTTWKEATEEEKATIEKGMSEGITNWEPNRFKVDPQQSYVPKETRESDPDFWSGK